MSTANRRVKRWPGWVALVLVVVGLFAVGVTRDAGPQTEGDRIDGIARRIACPICDGESVYESRNNASVSIRTEIEAQVRDGVRTDDEIIGYIADRYRGDVLLVPRATGLDTLVWALPVAALGVRPRRSGGRLPALAAGRTRDTGARPTTTTRSSSVRCVMPTNPDRLAELEEERRFLLRSLADLEREHDAGDVDVDDYQTLRDGYTVRAASVLRSIDDGRSTAPRRAGRGTGAGTSSWRWSCSSSRVVSAGSSPVRPGSVSPARSSPDSTHATRSRCCSRRRGRSASRTLRRRPRSTARSSSVIPTTSKHSRTTAGRRRSRRRPPATHRPPATCSSTRSRSCRGRPSSIPRTPIRSASSGSSSTASSARRRWRCRTSRSASPADRPPTCATWSRVSALRSRPDIDDA